MRGEGSGLPDLDRRASSCRKGMGENIGVEGAEERFMFPRESDATSPPWLFSCPGDIGKESHVDVTSKDFSTARRYFPRYL